MKNGQNRTKKCIKAFDEVGGSRDCLYISKTEFRPLIEAMGTAHCEDMHRRTIKNLEVDGKFGMSCLCEVVCGPS